MKCVLNLLQYCFCFMFFFCLFVCFLWSGGIWDFSSEPGIKSGSPTLEGKILTTTPLGKFQTEPGLDLFLNQPDF